MVITRVLCERCGGSSACTNQELHIRRGDISGNCRTEDELRKLAVEVDLNAEYEVERLQNIRQGVSPDGSPGPKLAQAMAQRPAKSGHYGRLEVESVDEMAD